MRAVSPRLGGGKLRERIKIWLTLQNGSIGQGAEDDGKGLHNETMILTLAQVPRSARTPTHASIFV